MSRGIFAGDTDYTRQSFDEMIADIKNWAKSISNTQDFFQKNLKLLKKERYLDSNVPDDFKILISRTTCIYP